MNKINSGSLGSTNNSPNSVESNKLGSKNKTKYDHPYFELTFIKDYPFNLVGCPQ